MQKAVKPVITCTQSFNITLRSTHYKNRLEYHQSLNNISTEHCICNSRLYFLCFNHPEYMEELISLEFFQLVCYELVLFASGDVEHCYCQMDLNAISA